MNISAPSIQIDTVCRDSNSNYLSRDGGPGAGRRERGCAPRPVPIAHEAVGSDASGHLACILAGAVTGQAYAAADAGRDEARD